MTFVSREEGILSVWTPEGVIAFPGGDGNMIHIDPLGSMYDPEPILGTVEIYNPIFDMPSMYPQDREDPTVIKVNKEEFLNLKRALIQSEMQQMVNMLNLHQQQLQELDRELMELRKQLNNDINGSGS